LLIALYLYREERQLIEHGIPFSAHHIINSSAEEFTLLQSNFQLNAEQVTLCRDIRRRGKNKVGSQPSKILKLKNGINLNKYYHHRVPSPK
jgi:hypothetical protein